MGDPIQVSVRNTVGNMVGRAIITDENIREIIARAAELGPLPDWVVDDNSDSLANLFRRKVPCHFGGSFGGPTYVMRDGGRVEIQAPAKSAPAGEGPALDFSVPQADALAAMAEVERLKKQVEQLNVSVTLAVGRAEFAEATIDGYSKALANAQKLPDSELELAQERDAAIARAEKEKLATEELHKEALDHLRGKEKAEAERDALKIEVEQLRCKPSICPPSELDTRWQELVRTCDDRLRRAQAAESDRDAFKVKAERIKDELSAVKRLSEDMRKGASDLALGVYKIREALGLPAGMCGPNTPEIIKEINRAMSDLRSWHAAARKVTAERDGAIERADVNLTVANDRAKEINRLRAELAAEKARADKAEESDRKHVQNVNDCYGLQQTLNKQIAILVDEATSARDALQRRGQDPDVMAGLSIALSKVSKIAAGGA